MTPEKPLGHKNYGSIPHLPGSRLGSGDHHCSEGQARIATKAVRDKYDTVIVQEKLDGSNVGVARVGNTIIPLGRAGWPAISSPYLQHRYFHNWAWQNYERFMSVLNDGERLVGEWLALAHGTKYTLHHEPFVAFDLMTGTERLPYEQFESKVKDNFVMPLLIWKDNKALSIEDAMAMLLPYGGHGAVDLIEGAIWRVERDKPTGRKGERKRVVDFLVKYVRPDKVDGLYLDKDVWNWKPGDISP